MAVYQPYQLVEHERFLKDTLTEREYWWLVEQWNQHYTEQHLDSLAGAVARSVVE